MLTAVKSGYKVVYSLHKTVVIFNKEAYIMHEAAITQVMHGSLRKSRNKACNLVHII